MPERLPKLFSDGLRAAKSVMKCGSVGGYSNQEIHLIMHTILQFVLNYKKYLTTNYPIASLHYISDRVANVTVLCVFTLFPPSRAPILTRVSFLHNPTILWAFEKK